MRKFWDLKTRFRKSLSLTNRTIAVIESLQEETNENPSNIIERLIRQSPEYRDTLNVLKNDYRDIDNQSTSKELR